jgi:hypothetical protein
MTLMDTLARAEAVAAGRAVPAATVRHRHVARNPLVFVPLTTAGEAGAPLGAMVGTERGTPHLLVVPQPLDRELRFGFFAGLAAVMLPLLESYSDAVEVEPATRNREETEVCADAPQIVVPNSAALEYVRLLGRSTRFLRTAEDPDAPHPVPVPVPLLGRWLTHYAERARTPGSALLVAMTELLTRHWATGQSAMEDQHLGALLGWIEPPPGLDGVSAAARAQTGRGPDGLLLSPPAGPATDPLFDNRALAPAMVRYDKARESLAGLAAAGRDGRARERPEHSGEDALGHREQRSAGSSTDARQRAALAAAEADVRRLVASQLRPTWDDIWHGLDLLHALPEGAHVPDRWKRDRWSFTGHRDRVRAGEPPQPKRDDAITAAQKLAGRETAQARLFAQEALDDPLAMSARRLAGEAFTGDVIAVEMAFTDTKRPMPRPLVTLTTPDLPQAEPATKAYRARHDGTSAQTAELVSVGPGPGPGIVPGPPDHFGAPASRPAASPGHAPDAPDRSAAGTSEVPGTPSRAGASTTGTSAAPVGTFGSAGGIRDVPGRPGSGAAGVRQPAGRPGSAPAPAAPTWLVTVRLTGGMGSGRTPREGSVPAVGDRVCFTLFAHEPRGGPALPEAEQTPWTHGGPPGRAVVADGPDVVTAEDFL